VELNDRLIASNDVVAREVGGETMLLDLASGTYFGLDPIGGKVWQLLEGGCSLGEACDAIAAEYEIGRQELEQDLLALAENLAAKNLIVAADQDKSHQF
jgi:hypothetical protein